MLAPRDHNFLFWAFTIHLLPEYSAALPEFMPGPGAPGTEIKLFFSL